MKKPKTVGKLKKELDTIYSRYIRLKEADSQGYATCISCGQRWQWKDLQCGHFVSRRYSNTRFDERNTKPQCVGCNLFRGGNHANYAENLIKMYGDGIIQELAKKSRVMKTFTTKELKDMIATYKELYELLEK